MEYIVFAFSHLFSHLFSPSPSHHYTSLFRGSGARGCASGDERVCFRRQEGVLQETRGWTSGDKRMSFKKREDVLQVARRCPSEGRDEDVLPRGEMKMSFREARGCSSEGREDVPPRGERMFLRGTRGCPSSGERMFLRGARGCPSKR